jgi:hypothetical protein
LTVYIKAPFYYNTVRLCLAEYLPAKLIEITVFHFPEIMVVGLWTAICGGVITLFTLVVWYTSPTYTPNEPRAMAHTIPFIGHLIPFAKDRRSLFTKFS